jgi:hypothetical protein
MCYEYLLSHLCNFTLESCLFLYNFSPW